MPVAWIEDAKTGATRTIDEIMRDVLIFVYGKHGTVRAAADALGVSKSTFAAWCDQLDVKIERPGRKGVKFSIPRVPSGARSARTRASARGNQNGEHK